MGIIERGVKSFIHPGAEYKNQISELINLNSEDLRAELKKTVIKRWLSDGGKYIPIFGTYILGSLGKIPPDVECVLIPITGGITLAGFTAESYYTIRNRAALNILYDRGILKSPSKLRKELKENFQITLKRIKNSPPKE